MAETFKAPKLPRAKAFRNWQEAVRHVVISGVPRPALLMCWRGGARYLICVSSTKIFVLSLNVATKLSRNPLTLATLKSGL